MRYSYAEYIQTLLCRCSQALLKRSTLWALAGLLKWSSLIRICSVCADLMSLDLVTSFYYCAEFASAYVTSASWSWESSMIKVYSFCRLPIFTVALNFSAILVPNFRMLTVQTLVGLLRSSSLTRVCTFCHLT